MYLRFKNLSLLQVCFEIRCYDYITGQQSDALATALNEVANSQGALVAQEDGPASIHVKHPLSALAAAAELDQVRNDVSVVSWLRAFLFSCQYTFHKWSYSKLCQDLLTIAL